MVREAISKMFTCLDLAMEQMERKSDVVEIFLLVYEQHLQDHVTDTDIEITYFIEAKVKVVFINVKVVVQSILHYVIVNSSNHEPGKLGIVLRFVRRMLLIFSINLDLVVEQPL